MCIVSGTVNEVALVQRFLSGVQEPVLSSRKTLHMTVRTSGHFTFGAGKIW